MVKVNAGKDFIERVGWTLLELLAGLGSAQVIFGDATTWWAVLFTGVVASAKVAIAQRVGQHADGAAIPGGVIQATRP